MRRFFAIARLASAIARAIRIGGFFVGTHALSSIGSFLAIARRAVVIDLTRNTYSCFTSARIANGLAELIAAISRPALDEDEFIVDAGAFIRNELLRMIICGGVVLFITFRFGLIGFRARLEATFMIARHDASFGIATRFGHERGFTFAITVIRKFDIAMNVDIARAEIFIADRTGRWEATFALVANRAIALIVSRAIGAIGFLIGFGSDAFTRFALVRFAFVGCGAIGAIGFLFGFGSDAFMRRFIALVRLAIVVTFAFLTLIAFIVFLRYASFLLAEIRNAVAVDFALRAIGGFCRSTFARLAVIRSTVAVLRTLIAVFARRRIVVVATRYETQSHEGDQKRNTQFFHRLIP